jgi:hypothetical protein
MSEVLIQNKKLCPKCSLVYIGLNSKTCKKCVNVGRKHTQEHKDKSIKARTGLTRSEETKQKMSESAIAYAKAHPIAKEDHSWFGRNHTEEAKEKNRLAHLGKKDSKETLKKKSLAKLGPKHFNWIDGRSYLPYIPQFTNLLKDEIRTRDNFQCQGQDCNMTREEHLLVYDQSLHVHHIDYDKQNCDKSNLIATCLQCNLKANHDRDYWQEYYTNKMKELYRGRS